MFILQNYFNFWIAAPFCFLLAVKNKVHSLSLYPIRVRVAFPITQLHATETDTSISVVWLPVLNKGFVYHRASSSYDAPCCYLKPHNMNGWFSLLCNEKINRQLFKSRNCYRKRTFLQVLVLCVFQNFRYSSKYFCANLQTKFGAAMFV